MLVWPWLLISHASCCFPAGEPLAAPWSETFIPTSVSLNVFLLSAWNVSWCETYPSLWPHCPVPPSLYVTEHATHMLVCWTITFTGLWVAWARRLNSFKFCISNRIAVPNIYLLLNGCLLNHKSWEDRYSWDYKNKFFDLDLTSRHPQFLGQVYISGQFKFFFWR